MNLYIKDNDIYSDIANMIFSIKGANPTIINISDKENAEHVKELKTTLSDNLNVPILKTDYNTIHGIGILIEAAEDLYPYPPLFPVFPKQRANARILLEYVNKNFLVNIDKLIFGNLSEQEKQQIKYFLEKNIVETYKTVSREREINAESNPDAQNVNVLTLVMTLVFYYFLKLKINIPIQEKILIKDIKNLFAEPNFIKIIKQKQ